MLRSLESGETPGTYLRENIVLVHARNYARQGAICHRMSAICDSGCAISTHEFIAIMSC